MGEGGVVDLGVGFVDRVGKIIWPTSDFIY